MARARGRAIIGAGTSRASYRIFSWGGNFFFYCWGNHVADRL